MMLIIISYNSVQKSHEIARENLINMKGKSKDRYDRSSTSNKSEIGDLVHLLNEQSKKGLSKKHEIIEVHEPPNVTLKIGKKFVKVHTNRLKPQLVNITSNFSSAHRILIGISLICTAQGDMDTYKIDHIEPNQNLYQHKYRILAKLQYYVQKSIFGTN